MKELDKSTRRKITNSITNGGRSLNAVWNMQFEGYEKLILLYLAGQCDFNSTFTEYRSYSYERLSEKCGISVSTARRYVTKLIKKGYLKKEPRYIGNKQVGNSYSLTDKLFEKYEAHLIHRHASEGVHREHLSQKRVFTESTHDTLGCSQRTGEGGLREQANTPSIKLPNKNIIKPDVSGRQNKGYSKEDAKGAIATAYPPHTKSASVGLLVTELRRYGYSFDEMVIAAAYSQLQRSKDPVRQRDYWIGLCESIRNPPQEPQKPFSDPEKYKVNIKGPELKKGESLDFCKI